MQQGFGDRLRRAREDRGWSQAELGSKVCRSQTRVSTFETGRVVPDRGCLEQLAEALRVPIAWLESGEGPMDARPQDEERRRGEETARIGSHPIALRIRRAREARHRCQTWLADRIWVSQTRISMFETGKAVPDRDTLHRISEALGVRLAWLESGEEPMDAGAEP